MSATVPMAEPSLTAERRRPECLFVHECDPRSTSRSVVCGEKPVRITRSVGLPSLAALPEYISNHVPRSRASCSADFGGCAGVTLRRVAMTACKGAGETLGRNVSASPGPISEVNLFGDGKSVIHLNAEISDGALNLVRVSAWGRAARNWHCLA